MSDVKTPAPTAPATPDAHARQNNSLMPASDLAKVLELEIDPTVKLCAKVVEPDDSHKEMLLEAVGQLLSSSAQALYIDPTHEACRVAIAHEEGQTELANLELPSGRALVETLRRASALNSSAEHPIYGGYHDGLLRVEYNGIEHRLLVHLVPTVHGVSATLRALKTVPPANEDLLALGLTSTQEEAILNYLAKGTGLLLLGGPDPAGLTHTYNTLLARAAKLGRRPAVISSEHASDVQGILRIETPADETDAARAVVKAGQAGIPLIFLEQIQGPEVARAAAWVSFHHKVSVVAMVASQNAIDTLVQFNAYELPPPLGGTIALSTCQVQIPTLCTTCQRWGESSREDLAFFGLQGAKSNFNVRGGCSRCNGQPIDMIQIFECLQVPDSTRGALRSGTALDSLQGELLNAPGYTPFLRQVAGMVQEGRVSLAEARHYLSWQLPSVATFPK